MNIEKLQSLKTAVADMIDQGLSTLEPVRRYGDSDVSGSYYQVKEHGSFVVHPVALQAMNDNLLVLQAGIDYILSHVSNREVYDESFNEHLNAVSFHSGVASKRKNPINESKAKFASAFGVQHYQDENFSIKDLSLDFQGLSNIISISLLDALKDLTQRKSAAIMFLAHSQVVSQGALRFNLYKEQYAKDLHNLYDRHGWTSATEFKVDVDESFCGLDDSSMIKVYLDRDDITSLFNAGVKNNDIRSSGKKVIISSVKEVQADEVADAAKKIKTVTDLNGLKLYRIEKGIVIKNSQEVNDYWNWRRFDDERKAKAVGSLEGHYLAIMDTPENSFQTVGTSLGRTISSCSKQLQNKVMESLDLDDLI
jgi:hypothetical protein